MRSARSYGHGDGLRGRPPGGHRGKLILNNCKKLKPFATNPNRTQSVSLPFRNFSDKTNRAHPERELVIKKKDY